MCVLRADAGTAGVDRRLLFFGHPLSCRHVSKLRSTVILIIDLPFLSEQSKKNILGLNAARIFNLDPTPVKQL